MKIGINAGNQVRNARRRAGPAAGRINDSATAGSWSVRETAKPNGSSLVVVLTSVDC